MSPIHVHILPYAPHVLLFYSMIGYGLRFVPSSWRKLLSKASRRVWRDNLVIYEDPPVF
ncbi:hypothetical protein CPB83DRAFT_843583 [Crepidotus variabilis]|uniref:Uncharacterized protein n=1 Tax=Crepidotus variabilis TaxID=179855 RepID=A0A9P6JW36_9AGAR|nr:hypothetical protein CPB83DRAFT_843583 [Crepidotus variabilis]